MLCSRKFLVSKNLMETRGGGGYQDFPSKSFCLRVPKKIIGAPISVSLFLGIDKFYALVG